MMTNKARRSPTLLPPFLPSLKLSGLMTHYPTLRAYLFRFLRKSLDPLWVSGFLLVLVIARP